MRRYGTVTVCPKCGYDVLGEAYDRWSSKYGPSPCSKANGHDHIDRWCKRCHYMWIEACLDSILGEASIRQ